MLTSGLSPNDYGYTSCIIYHIFLKSEAILTSVPENIVLQCLITEKNNWKPLAEKINVDHLKGLET